MPVDKEVVDRQINALGDFDRWFTKKERKYLPEIMRPGETILAMTSGMYNGNTWLITVTDRRLLFLDKGLIYGLKQLEMPLAQIKAISHKTGIFYGKIEVSTGGSVKIVDTVLKRETKKIAQVISDALLESKSAKVSPPPLPPSCTTAVRRNDVVSQLERLAALKERGVLTEEEFNQQKAKLLSV